jgi:hypothetical protein
MQNALLQIPRRNLRLEMERPPETTRQEWQLIQNVIQRSTSQNWEQARIEWAVASVRRASGSTCICTHHPITKLFRIVNQRNENSLEVGCECVKFFLPEGSARPETEFNRRMRAQEVRQQEEEAQRRVEEARRLEAEERRRQLSQLLVSWAQSNEDTIPADDLLDFAYEERFVDDWQWKFLKDIRNKERRFPLNQNQLNKRASTLHQFRQKVNL